MEFNNYTPEIFVENFLKDSEVFGLRTAQAIYEEVFSTICNKKVKLDNFINELCEEINTLTEEDIMSNVTDFAFADNTGIPGFKAVAKTLNNYAGALSDEKRATMAKTIAKNLPTADEAVKATAGGGVLTKIAGFLKGLPAKVKTFFGGLQGKSFSEIMQNGLGWLQANPALAFKSAGGIALILMLIKALKKRGELNRYGQLAAIEARRNQLKEDCYDTVLEDTKEKETMRKVLKECETNKRLEALIFEETKDTSKEKYMNY